MKKLRLFLGILTILGIGCQKKAIDDAHEHATVQQTVWTDKVEVFAEYSTLLAGEPSRLILHLTNLATFKPITRSSVGFQLTNSHDEQFNVQAPMIAEGIYASEVTFPESGLWQFSCRYDDHIVNLESVTVLSEGEEHAEHEEAHDAEIDEHDHGHSDGITYLKEQQWQSDFQTEMATVRTLCTSVVATGEIMPRISSDIIVSAPFTGMILPDHNPHLPQIGAKMDEGNSLVVMTPSVNSGEDNFAAQYIIRKNALDLAQIDLERAKRLFEKLAISQKQVQEAQAQYDKAAADFGTLSASVEKFDTKTLFGPNHKDIDFLLHSPINGTVEEIYFQLGRQLESGTPLFRIVNTDRVWLKIHVPVSSIADIEEPERLTLALHGQQSIDLTPDNSRLISIGNVVDPDNRTVPVIFEVINSHHNLKIGMYADITLYSSCVEQVVAIPESALTEDEGHYSVFVQTGGESFVQEEVVPGIKDFGYVEIAKGLHEGDRVVTQGAYRIKLASLSTSLPAHGHVH